MKDMSYLPTLYLYHPFLQSVYNVLTLERYNIDYRREILSLPDQGQISLDWAYSAKEMPEKKNLIYFAWTDRRVRNGLCSITCS